jgi:hypothetical protein
MIEQEYEYDRRWPLPPLVFSSLTNTVRDDE